MTGIDILHLSTRKLTSVLPYTIDDRCRIAVNSDDAQLGADTSEVYTPVGASIILSDGIAEDLMAYNSRHLLAGEFKAGYLFVVPSFTKEDVHVKDYTDINPIVFINGGFESELVIAHDAAEALAYVNGQTVVTHTPVGRAVLEYKSTVNKTSWTMSAVAAALKEIDEILHAKKYANLPF